MFTMIFLGFITTTFATEAKKQLQLNLVAQNSATDQTTIYFDLGVSPLFLTTEDFAKQMNSIPGIPNLYTLSSDNVKCSTNGYGTLTQSAVIGLGVLLDTSGLYTFRIGQSYNFDSTTLIVLEDRKLNVFTEMQVNFYQVQLTPQDTTGRFFLHITKAVQFVSDTAGCANNDGAISITADSTIIWNFVSLSDSGNAPVATVNNAGGQFSFSRLSEGLYNLTFNYSGYAIAKQVFVSGTHIISGFTASSQNVAVGETIDFNSTTINTSQYVWDFGDSTIVTGVQNPTFFYYLPGTYTVTLICTNSYGCSANVQMTIHVADAAGISNTTAKGISIINLTAKTVQVNMNDVPLNNAELDIYNILGQSIYTSPVTVDQMQVSLNNQPAGIYVVTVRQGSKATTAKIYVTN